MNLEKYSLNVLLKNKHSKVKYRGTWSKRTSHRVDIIGSRALLVIVLVSICPLKRNIMNQTYITNNNWKNFFYTIFNFQLLLDQFPLLFHPRKWCFTMMVFSMMKNVVMISTMQFLLLAMVQKREKTFGLSKILGVQIGVKMVTSEWSVTNTINVVLRTKRSIHLFCNLFNNCDQ